jgi:hypothetical protein
VPAEPGERLRQLGLERADEAGHGVVRRQAPGDRDRLAEVGCRQVGPPAEEKGAAEPAEHDRPAEGGRVAQPGERGHEARRPLRQLVEGPCLRQERRGARLVGRRGCLALDDVGEQAVSDPGVQAEGIPRLRRGDRRLRERPGLGEASGLLRHDSGQLAEHVCGEPCVPARPGQKEGLAVVPFGVLPAALLRKDAAELLLRDGLHGALAGRLEARARRPIARLRLVELPLGKGERAETAQVDPLRARVVQPVGHGQRGLVRRPRLDVPTERAERVAEIGLERAPEPSRPVARREGRRDGERVAKPARGRVGAPLDVCAAPEPAEDHGPRVARAPAEPGEDRLEDLPRLGRLAAAQELLAAGALGEIPRVGVSRGAPHGRPARRLS